MSEKTLGPCPICGATLNDFNDKPNIDGEWQAGHWTWCDCHRCGPFYIENHALTTAMYGQPDPLLPAWIRRHEEEGLETPKVTEQTLKEKVKDLQRHSALKKQLIIMQGIEAACAGQPGAEVGYNLENDYPLFELEYPEEFDYLLDVLSERHLIRRAGVRSDPVIRIEANGWDYLDEHSHERISSDQAFIAMSFGEDFDAVYDNGVYPAVDDAGYKPYRVDKEHFLGPIDAKIFNQIKVSRFMVAEVTEQNPGVYYEAGYALGLGMPIIWCVRADVLEQKKIHFDTRQVRHISWSTPDDLKSQLFEMIDFVIGKRIPAGKGST